MKRRLSTDLFTNYLDQQYHHVIATILAQVLPKIVYAFVHGHYNLVVSLLEKLDQTLKSESVFELARPRNIEKLIVHSMVTAPVWIPGRHLQFWLKD